MLLLLLILFIVANLFLFCCLLFSLTAFNLLPAAIVVFVVASEANNKPKPTTNRPNRITYQRDDPL